MLGWDLDKTVTAITEPFTKALADFDKQMSQLHLEVRETNELLRAIHRSLNDTSED